MQSSTPSSVDIYTDGSLNAKGSMGIGILFISKGKEIFRDSFKLPEDKKASSGYAEFTAVAMSLYIAKKFGIKRVRIHYDYEQIGIVVKNFNFIEDNTVKEFLAVYNELKKEFDSIEFIKVRSHRNKGNIIVDLLAKEATG